MRIKPAVLMAGGDASIETAAECGELADLLVEDASRAWHLRPERFPRLGNAEVLIDGRLVSLWGDVAAEAEALVDLAETLRQRLGFAAAAAGMADVEGEAFHRLPWVRHPDPRALLKFALCACQPVYARLVRPHSPTRCLLDAPSGAALEKACLTASECAQVLQPLSRVFHRIEGFDDATAIRMLVDMGATVEPVHVARFDGPPDPNVSLL